MKPTLKPAVTAADHRQGPDNAPVTLVEYGDFECPHCGHAYPIVEAVREEVGDKLLFVYRHFPLGEMHPHAEMAAEAAEAAGAKFWAMHDMLFRHQQALDTTHLSQYAAKIGIDLTRFNADLSSGKFRQHVHENFMSGVHSGVNGTPTFFINGVRYDGNVSVRDLVAAINEASVPPA